jgi:hypothetical protein
MYQRAFHWVHAAYVDGPTRQLTPVQVERACGVDASVCTQVLEDLVRAKVLVRTPEGAYMRAPREASRGDQVIDNAGRRAPA